MYLALLALLARTEVRGQGHSRYLSGPLRQLLSGLGFTGQVMLFAL